MPPCLKTETVRVDDALVCVLVGELILDSEPVAARALASALDRHPALLAVDLAGVDFCTSTGLNLLLTARRRAATDGIAFALVNPSRATLRVLELTDTLDLFDVYASVGDALRGRSAPPG